MIKRLRKIFIVILGLSFIFLIGCKKDEAPEKDFLEIMTETTSYCVEGIMESFYTEGRKQNEFKVYYKSADLIKVTLNSVDSDEVQTILKNKNGVYVLIPKINKNFRIQSNWPTNASYPYLLTSLAKDIANATSPIITEDENSKTIETETYLYKDAVANKQKIILDKSSRLPKEVLIYDKQGNLYIRVVFTKIDLNVTIDDKEFEVNDTLTTLRSMYTEVTSYTNRSIKYPIYCPSGCALSKENTVASTDGKEVRSIMTFSGTYGFTIIQEYVNDKETMSYAQESGELIFVLGVPTIIKTNGIQTVYEGVEYTIASKELTVEEMINILVGYMTFDDEK